MTPVITQQDRLFHLDTPLGGDVLITRSFNGSEGLSQLFHFHLVLASEDHNIDFDEVLRKPATLGIRQSDGTTFRYFNGIISRIVQQPQPGRLAIYHAELVPWVWLLTLTSNCLIYQNKTVPEVIQATFDKYKFRDYRLELTGKHLAWEYCSQYRESAFAFVARLMEIEGMYYYFEHEQSKHTLVITDNRSTHKPCPFESTFRFDRVVGPGYKHDADTIYEWTPAKKVRPGKYAHRDYNFEKPDDTLAAHMDALQEAQSEGWSEDAGEQDLEQDEKKFEMYDYPGEYEHREEGEDWARLRIEEQETDYDVADGVSNCRSMLPGYKFDLVDHFRQDQNRSYLTNRVSHSGEEGTLIGGGDTSAATYENKFTCLPADVQFRPPRATRKHQMLGSQTAFVVGPPGEEIHTDNYGRVRVKFHWDRKKGRAEDSSCWMRVMQPWTGAQFGYQWIPRIGQEVVVDFLEGDPDRPIITGCVYNQNSMPPYTLPNKKTVSGIRSRSTKNGTDQNYNEIRLDDNIGEELFSMQAENDMYVLVKRDESEVIKRDCNLQVGRDRNKQIGGNQRLKVKGDQQELIEGNQQRTVRGNELEVVQGNCEISVGGDLVLAAAGGQYFSVQGEAVGQVGGSRNLQVDGSDKLRVTGTVQLEVGGDIHLKSAGAIIIQGAQVSLKGSNGFVDIGPGGVTIRGDMVLINSGGSAPDAAGITPSAPAQPRTFEPDPFAAGDPPMHTPD